jgi:hypothetical protein
VYRRIVVSQDQDAIYEARDCVGNSRSESRTCDSHPRLDGKFSDRASAGSIIVMGVNEFAGFSEISIYDHWRTGLRRYTRTKRSP